MLPASSFRRIVPNIHFGTFLIIHCVAMAAVIYGYLKSFFFRYNEKLQLGFGNEF